MKKILILSFAFIFPICARAQTPANPPAISTWTLTSTAVALPDGRQTIVGTEAGIQVQVTQNLALKDVNLLAPGDNLQGFYGGVTYDLPVLSAKLNNVSPNLNGYRFQFFITASAGVDRITQGGNTRQHYSFLAGGGVNYDLGSGTFSLGGQVEYAKLPGLANNTAIVSFGPAIHF